MKKFSPLARFGASIDRRQFVTGLACGAGMSGLGWAADAPAEQGLRVLRGNRFDLDIGYREVNLTGRTRIATVINGGLPGPLLRWREGDEVVLRVKNNLATDSSIHWHGMILPAGMDGVPGISYAGICPGDSFTYRFPVQQSGTYWYHSHSGFQEQTGMYGAIVIDPVEPEPFAYDRDYVVLLSDWSDEKPERIFGRLRKEGHYYNTNPRTLGDFGSDIRAKGAGRAWADRAMWNSMRMNDRDISDVTGLTYTFLMNGNAPDRNWTGLFARGEKVRLRFVNASAMTIFDVRIPGLKMTVVTADGQYVAPVTVDEFRLGTAETYDVIVEPVEGAYTLFAQAIDRSGYARGTLAEQAGMAAEVPKPDLPVTLTHADMDMGQMADHAHHHGAKASAKGMVPAPAGGGSQAAVEHASTEFGYNVDMRAKSPVSRLDDPGVGLRNNGRRVLTYSDLHSLLPTADKRDPVREVQLHLTGNMHRYLWSINGVPFADAEPLQLKLHERMRITLVNDTMMNHPIHLHGMWSELETGDAGHIPLKHTVIVQPSSKLSYLITPEIPGSWAYHCHLLFHMMGMFRQVDVS